MTPTVCRMVHYWPDGNDQEARQNSNSGPLAAIITRVHGPSIVNLQVFPDWSTGPVWRTSVPLAEDPRWEPGCWSWPALELQAAAEGVGTEDRPSTLG